MKKTTIVLSLIALTLIWASCKKKDNNTAVQVDTVVYAPGMHAVVNGKTWNNYNVDNSSITGGGHYQFEFGGTDTNNVKISIYIADATGTGIHSFTATSADKAYYTIDTGIAPVKIYATSGQLSITTINDSVVKGSFNFTAGPNEITSGTLNMTF